MNYKSFKLLIGFGVCALAATSAPACGGDDDGGGSSGSGGKDAGSDTATGGAGGTGGSGGSGGTGATGGSGGSGGSGGGTTMTCGSNTCKSYNVVIADLPPCCAGSSNDKCGVNIDQSLADQIGIKGGCFELNQPGNADSNCPPLTGVPVINTLPGCCNAGKSKCSYMIDISALGGPNMGCVDPDNVPASEAGPPKACTPGQPGDGGTDGSTEGGDAASDSATDSATDSASDAASDAPADTTAG